jgi:cyclase
MEMTRISKSCYAVFNEKNRVCDASSGLINQGGGVVIDTQSDLPHAQRMIELFSTVWPAMPKRVILTHEDGDHVWGNQLFKGAEIIAHRSVPEQMRRGSDPEEMRKLLYGIQHAIPRFALNFIHPGAVAIGQQLLEDYDFDGLELVMPTTLFDTRHYLDLDGLEAVLIYVGPCHQVGDTIVHVPKEGVVFAGDVVFQDCTPMGWTGTYEKWFDALDLIIDLNPEFIVPGHGPICRVDDVRGLKAYFEYVRNQSRKFFDEGLSSEDASKRIELGPYAGWRAPARLYMNVERAYREFRGEPVDKPWDKAATFDAVYHVAAAKGVPIEF